METALAFSTSQESVTFSPGAVTFDGVEAKDFTVAGFGATGAGGGFGLAQAQSAGSSAAAAKIDLSEWRIGITITEG
jgi:hypothetical protein